MQRRWDGGGGRRNENALARIGWRERVVCPCLTEYPSRALAIDVTRADALHIDVDLRECADKRHAVRFITMRDHYSYTDILCLV